jgi:DNA repair exonuclease SbcCD ATPase subunit
MFQRNFYLCRTKNTPMKKWIFLIILLCPLITLASKDDSLLQRRSELYYQYLDFKNNADSHQTGDFRQLSQLLENLVIYDNQVVDSLESVSERYQKLKGNADENGSGLLGMKDSTGGVAGIILWIIAGALIISTAIVFIMNGRKKVLRREMAALKEELEIIRSENEHYKEDLSLYDSKLTDKETHLKRILKEKETLEASLKESNESSGNQRHSAALRITALENENTEISKRLEQYQSELTRLRKEGDDTITRLNSENRLLAQKSGDRDREMDELKNQIHDLKDIIDNFEETVREKDHAIEHLHHDMDDLERRLLASDNMLSELRRKAPHDDDYYRKISELDLNMIKLEKLERLYKEKSIAEEEYRELKKKYLSSL